MTKGHSFLDETGNKYGLLTVLKRDPWRGLNTKVKWICLCDCGNQTSVTGTNLRSGKTKSCGCLHAKAASERAKIRNAATIKDYTGFKLNMLTFEKFLRSDGVSAIWQTKCSCGKIIERRPSTLIAKNTFSCGCATLSKALELARNKAIKNKRFMGVNPSRGKFGAKISNLPYLGTFKSPYEAAKAYDEAAIKLYGDNAILNFEDDEE